MKCKSDNSPVIDFAIHIGDLQSLELSGFDAA